MNIRTRACAVVLPLGLALGGCASSGAISEDGVRIGDETLKQFQAGTTTEAWLLAILGEPTSWSVVEGVENTRVYRYATRERSGGGLMSLVTGSGGKDVAVTYFIVTDGIVTRYWADRAEERTLLGKPVEKESGEKGAATGQAGGS